ncbi:hypothetical protein CRM22_003843 [Opisthorchis felineus]|uniref:Uncharacterized protein n=1 Tax=Opisthorchis felineus TaxID=147828 RepID=A0A4S2LZ90_OPIFE|nr:hypothetical protein CRM22_003843 [Opisthorchis felineus]
MTGKGVRSTVAAADLNKELDMMTQWRLLFTIHSYGFQGITYLWSTGYLSYYAENALFVNGRHYRLIPDGWDDRGK